MPETPATTFFEDAIDIPAWLETDAARPLRERVARDREIGVSLAAGDGATRVRRWWQRIGERGDALPGRRLHHARSWINLTLALIGLVGGVGVALAAFRYDGTYPVNVVRLLAILVVPQVVLLALNLFLIPGRVPGLRFIQDALAALNPGALAAQIFRQITGQAESRIFAWAAARNAAMRRYGKWQMLFWSQIAAVAFNAGVIATAAMLIAFTDIAFGWSTTLSVDTGTASRIFGTIAAPWADLFPSSVPDTALVERSQFFRLEGYTGLADSRALTGWWSFSVLAVVTYGLLPRLAFLTVAGWRLHAATRNLLLHDSRVVALLDRMAAPALETSGEQPAEGTPEPLPAAGTAAPTALEGRASALIWNGSAAAGAAPGLVGSRLGVAISTVFELGVGSLAEQRQMLERLAGTDDPVVVLTPGWEPPLLDFVDFLGQLRAVLGPAPSIIVMPVAENGQATLAVERENWSRAVERTGDPRAYVETGDA
jgi:hypothetical protein